MTKHDIEDFLATIGASAETVEHYRRRLRSMQAWASGKDASEWESAKPLASMTKADLERLKSKLRSMQSGHHYIVILRAFLADAGLDDLRKRAKIAQRTKRLVPADLLTVPDVQKLIKSRPATRDRALIAALYETGVRVSELLALNLGDVQHKDANGGPAGYVLSFRKVKVSGQEHRGFIYELVPVFEAWLGAHPHLGDPAAPLFPNYEGTKRLDRRAAWHIVSDAAKVALPGKKVWPHLFRHSRATHLKQRGVGEAEIRKLLGWAQGSTMVSRYVSLADADAERALLKSEGYEMPANVDIGSFDFSDEKLHPITPVARPPMSAPVGPSDGWVWDAEKKQAVWTLTDRERALMAQMDKRLEAMWAGMTPERLRYTADLMEAREKGEPFPTGDRAMKLIPADLREGTIFADPKPPEKPKKGTSK